MENDEPKELTTMLPNELFTRTIAIELRDRTISSTLVDSFAQSIKTCLKEKGTPPLRTALADWTLDDEIILYKDTPVSSKPYVY